MSGLVSLLDTPQLTSPALSSLTQQFLTLLADAAASMPLHTHRTLIPPHPYHGIHTSDTVATTKTLSGISGRSGSAGPDRPPPPQGERARHEGILVMHLEAYILALCDIAVHVVREPQSRPTCKARRPSLHFMCVWLFCWMRWMQSDSRFTASILDLFLRLFSQSTVHFEDVRPSLLPSPSVSPAPTPLHKQQQDATTPRPQQHQHQHHQHPTPSPAPPLAPPGGESSLKSGERPLQQQGPLASARLLPVLVRGLGRMGKELRHPLKREKFMR